MENDRWRQLVRYLPFAGAILIAAGLIAWFALWQENPREALAILAALGTFMYGGKEAGIPAGLAAGAPAPLVGLYVLIADFALVCLLYPRVHYDVHKIAAKRNLLGDYLRKARHRADSRKTLIGRYGSLGLFVFMLIPFAFNGPLVGAVFGRVAGLRTRQILPALFAAIFVTTVAWTTIYSFGFDLAAKIDARLPVIITAILMVTAAAAAVISAILAHRRSTLDDEGRRPPSASVAV